MVIALIVFDDSADFLVRRLQQKKKRWDRRKVQYLFGKIHEAKGPQGE